MPDPMVKLLPIWSSSCGQFKADGQYQFLKTPRWYTTKVKEMPISRSQGTEKCCLANHYPSKAYLHSPSPTNQIRKPRHANLIHSEFSCRIPISQSQPPSDRSRARRVRAVLRGPATTAISCFRTLEQIMHIRIFAVDNLSRAPSILN